MIGLFQYDANSAAGLQADQMTEDEMMVDRWMEGWVGWLVGE